MTAVSEEWEGIKRILVILAHPDDPEFFCGATIARWTAAGHLVSDCVITTGGTGASDITISSEDLAAAREVEQRAAAAILGVKSIRFLHHPDGYLIPNLEMRKEVVRVIRQERPDILVTCDPLNVFPGEAGISHPDHRAAGQIVVDAVFPAAGNAFFFPELRVEEGLDPHTVKEVWMSVTGVPNVILDVTDYWDRKIMALKEHKSQIGDPEKFVERMRSRRVQTNADEPPRFEERFRRLKLG
jgi:LmbE family N-acetylglucosaminyl deacetylase